MLDGLYAGSAHMQPRSARPPTLWPSGPGFKYLHGQRPVVLTSWPEQRAAHSTDGWAVPPAREQVRSRGAVAADSAWLAGDAAGARALTPGGSVLREQTATFRKPPGLTARAGAVYIVAGSGGKLSGPRGWEQAWGSPQYPAAAAHPASCVSRVETGSLVLDVVGDLLEGAFVTAQGWVGDKFVIDKRGGGQNGTAAPGGIARARPRRGMTGGPREPRRSVAMAAAEGGGGGGGEERAAMEELAEVQQSAERGGPLAGEMAPVTSEGGGGSGGGPGSVGVDEVGPGAPRASEGAAVSLRLTSAAAAAATQHAR